MRLKRLRRAWSKGAGAAAAVIVDRVRDAWEDCRLGIRTAGLIPIETLVGTWDDCHDYAPTSFRAFRAFMDVVHVESGRDVFVDVGCGKGRVLVMAAQYPFRRIIGIEMSPALAAMASANVSRVRRRCHDVAVWTGRASQFSFPDDASIVYFFNPFHGAELERVLDRLRQSVLAAPRRLQVVFNNPVHLVKELHRHPWLAERTRFAFEHDCVIFEAVA
jgi:trans-aconitate methyltransferase